LENRDCISILQSLLVVTRLAVLADIHGNLPALEAVLADLTQFRPEEASSSREAGVAESPVPSPCCSVPSPDVPISPQLRHRVLLSDVASGSLHHQLELVRPK
jgi:hypothetical protein